MTSPALAHDIPCTCRARGVSYAYKYEWVDLCFKVEKRGLSRAYMVASDYDISFHGSRGFRGSANVVALLFLSSLVCPRSSFESVAPSFTLKVLQVTSVLFCLDVS